MMTSNARSTQDRARGITLRFGYPGDNSVEVRYTRFSLLKSGWVEGHQHRSLLMTFNDQCLVADVVMELKLAADALGIVFGADPELTVAQPDTPPPCHNWRQLSEVSAQFLGWRLIHPFGPPEEALAFEIDD